MLAACGVCAMLAAVRANECDVVDAQVRASKLSFADVVKRLAAQNPSLPTFIAKQVSAGTRLAVFIDACIGTASRTA